MVKEAHPAPGQGSFDQLVKQIGEWVARSHVSPYTKGMARSIKPQTFIETLLGVTIKANANVPPMSASTRTVCCPVTIRLTSIVDHIRGVIGNHASVLPAPWVFKTATIRMRR